MDDQRKGELGTVASELNSGCFAGCDLPVCLSVRLSIRLSIRLQKLAAIPVTAFVGDESKRDFEKYIRLCFIKVTAEFGRSRRLFTSSSLESFVCLFSPQEDSTLDAAGRILKNWSKT